MATDLEKIREILAEANEGFEIHTPNVVFAPDKDWSDQGYDEQACLVCDEQDIEWVNQSTGPSGDDHYGYMAHPLSDGWF